MVRANAGIGLPADSDLSLVADHRVVWNERFLRFCARHDRNGADQNGNESEDSNATSRIGNSQDLDFIFSSSA